MNFFTGIQGKFGEILDNITFIISSRRKRKDSQQRERLLYQSLQAIPTPPSRHESPRSLYPTRSFTPESEEDGEEEEQREEVWSNGYEVESVESFDFRAIEREMNEIRDEVTQAKRLLTGEDVEEDMETIEQRIVHSRFRLANLKRRIAGSTW